MGIRNLKYLKFTKAEIKCINKMIAAGMLENTHLVEDSRIVVTSGKLIGTLCCYRDMDDDSHPRLLCTEIHPLGDHTSTCAFGYTFDINITNISAQLYHFCRAVKLYGEAGVAMGKFMG